MKILMISSYLPYPLFSGGHIRLYNLIKELSGEHEITLICEKRSHQTQEDIKEIERICKKVTTVARRKQWSLKNIVKTGVSSHSFLLTGHTHPVMRKRIQEELASNTFDLIHVETFYVFQNLPETSLPIVLVEHNIEYLVYKRYVARSSLFLRNLLSVDVSKIKKEEEFFWKKATKLVAVSETDKTIMAKAGVEPVVVPNGVNTEQFAFKNTKKLHQEKKILFIGDFRWVQNRDAVTFIIKEIWPTINREQNVILWIVGRNIPRSIKNLTYNTNIIFDEKNSTRPTEQLFQEAAVLLAPIRVGGGTSYKILEAMSCGTPVVTMQMSAESINARDNQEIMVGQTAEELAEKTLTLLQDQKVYERIARLGRVLIEKNYTWKKIAKKLEEVYESC